MALKFSSGLLSSLGGFGQGGAIPSDPRQQSLMQQYGVTNPMLLALGRSLGQAIPGLETRSAQEQAMDAVRKSRGRGAEAQRETINKLRGLGYDEQADKLEAKLTAQASEAVAMTQLNEAAEGGLITQEERDTYLKGIGTRTIDPSAGLRLIQGRRDEERGIKQRKKERTEAEQIEINSALKLYEKYKERGAFDEMPDLEADIKSGAYTPQAISQMGIRGIKEGEKRTNLLAFAKSQNADDVVMGMIKDRTLNTPQAINAMVNDGMLPVPQVLVDALAKRTDAISQSYLPQVPTDGRPVKASIVRDIRAHLARLEQQEAAEARQPKGLSVSGISNAERTEYKAALEDSDVKSMLSDVFGKPALLNFFDWGERDLSSTSTEAKLLMAEAEAIHTQYNESVPRGGEKITRLQALKEALRRRKVGGSTTPDLSDVNTTPVADRIAGRTALGTAPAGFPEGWTGTVSGRQVEIINGMAYPLK